MLLNEYIKKSKGKYTVKSKKGKNLGTYRSKKAAKKRLKQIEYFKHVKKEGIMLKDILNEIDLKSMKATYKLEPPINIEDFIEEYDMNLHDYLNGSTAVDFMRKFVDNRDVHMIKWKNWKQQDAIYQNSKITLEIDEQDICAVIAERDEGYYLAFFTQWHTYDDNHKFVYKEGIDFKKFFEIAKEEGYDKAQDFFTSNGYAFQTCGFLGFIRK